MSDDSSSDDDEPLMKSPCESESDSDVDRSIFRYDRKRFIKSSAIQTPENFANPVRAQRKRLKPSTDDQMSLLERKQDEQKKKLLARIDRTNVLNDDSDESIDGCEQRRSSDTDADNSIEILDDPEIISAAVAAKQSKKALDFTDSSDEDDNDVAGRPRIQTDDPLLERSRLARQQLTRAQRYHAEDVHVDTRVLDAMTPLSVATKAKHGNKDKGNVEDLGKPLQLACKIKQEINGRSHPIVQLQYSTKQNETIQKLINRILVSNSLPLSSRVKVTFDGIILEKHRTPGFYHILDEDQLEIHIAANIAPNLNDDRTKSANGQSLNLKLRRRVEKKVEEIEMRIGSREPLNHLVDNYCKLQNLEQDSITLYFDGEKLDLSKTPQAYDMESGELLDVNCNVGSEISCT